MNPEPDIHEAARRLIGVFDKMQVPYAIGGAVAMAFAGFVRATRDVDVLALVPALRFQELADQLAEAGFVMRDEGEKTIPPDAARMAAASREFGYFRVWQGETKADVFLPKVPLQDSVLRRRVRVDLADFPMWVTTTEDLVLLKMVFHRPKDLEDVRHLLAANKEEIDVSYLKEWAAKTLEGPVAQELLELMGRAGIII
ncbi:MAG: hypothetical protein HY927_10450 [Elusimicrobia bacterium]|nr:hypothetical protein [Elusimicrobiota bacterium]